MEWFVFLLRFFDDFCQLTQKKLYLSTKSIVCPLPCFWVVFLGFAFKVCWSFVQAGFKNYLNFLHQKTPKKNYNSIIRLHKVNNWVRIELAINKNHKQVLGFMTPIKAIKHFHKPWKLHNQSLYYKGMMVGIWKLKTIFFHFCSETMKKYQQKRKAMMYLFTLSK